MNKINDWHTIRNIGIKSHVDAFRGLNKTLMADNARKYKIRLNAKTESVLTNFYQYFEFSCPGLMICTLDKRPILKSGRGKEVRTL